MKKILLLFIILTISSLLFLIFNDKGNEYLKPYLSTYLESQFKQNVKVEVQDLQIDYEHIKLIATLNKLTTLNAHGDYSLLNKTLNINYTLNSNGFKSKEVSFSDKIELQGDVKGYFSDMQIRGKGIAFKSKLEYALNLKDDLLNNIRINIKKADIAQLLLLTTQPSYAQGKVDIEVNIPSLEKQQTTGKAHIVLHKTKLNKKVFEKEFHIKLPKDTQLTGNIDADITKDLVKFTADINSNISKLKITKANYQLKKEELSANYLLNIPKMSKLFFLTKKHLFGKFEAKGSLHLKKRHLSLKLLSKSLGGEAKISLNDNKLNANLSNLELHKIFYLLGKQPYLQGQLSSNIKLSDLKNLTGNFTLDSHQLRTIHRNFKKKFNLDFGKSIELQLNTQGEIKSHIVHIQTKINSELFNLQSSDMEYHLKKSTLLATYILNLPNLSKLNKLAGKKLQGKLDINGKILLDKTLQLTGKTNNLEGVVDFDLKGDSLHANIKDISVQKLMHLLDYPQIFKASLLGKFDYNLATRQGTFTSTLNKAQLLANNLTNLVKQIRGVDLTKERYTQTHFNAKLHKELINFDFNTESKTVHLGIKNGKINKLVDTIDADYKLNIENKDIRGKIKGDISKPKVTIDGSQFIQDALIDKVKDRIGTKTLEKLGIGEKETDAIKDILGDLFK